MTFQKASAKARVDLVKVHEVGAPQLYAGYKIYFIQISIYNINIAFSFSIFKYKALPQQNFWIS